MILLREDRPRMGTDRHGMPVKTIFLKAGAYDKLRMIPGLGWLVATPGYRDKMQTSVIKFDSGEETE